MGFSDFQSPGVAHGDDSALSQSRKRELVFCIDCGVVVLRWFDPMGSPFGTTREFLLRFCDTMSVAAPELRWFAGDVCELEDV
jgi:hypothetical protein